MKNDRKSIIICAVFLTLLAALMLVPFLGMAFAGVSGTDSENRDASPFPSFFKDGGIDLSFGTEFESWFADRFALRRELVQADADIKLGVFGTSPEDDVIAGRDGWLFYADTVYDHCREERLSESDLRRLVTVIRLESEYARRNGAAYVFAAAPNKNTIYPEKMPAWIPAGEGDSLYDRLVAALKEENVPVADLKTALLDAADRGLLYYTGDSHWNLLGSNAAAEAICEAVKAQRSDFAEWSLRDEACLSAGSREDDLLKMVRPLSPERVEEYAADGAPDGFTAVTRMRSLDDLVIKTRRNSVTGADGQTAGQGTELKLYAFRDSFGRALIKPLSETFSESTFTRSKFDLAGEIDENTVVLREIVERNIPDLLKTAPVIEAPLASDLSGAEVREGAVSFTESAGVLTHVYGYVPVTDKTRGGDALTERIFVSVGGLIYEAFPIAEEKLLPDLEGKTESIRGFSLYIPERIVNEAGGVIEVLF